MHGLSTEHHVLDSVAMAEIAVNVAEHLVRYRPYGRAAIVTDDPLAFWVELQKVWHRVGQELKRDGKLDQLAYVRAASFTITPPIQESHELVQIATVKDFLAWPPQAAMMYVTCAIKREQLHMITSWMPKYGTVVLYGEPKQ